MPITHDAGTAAAEQADMVFNADADGMRITPEPNAQVSPLLRSMLNDWAGRQTGKSTSD
jgi:hypothetical protein